MIRHSPRQSRRGEVDLVRPVAETVFLEFESASPKGVGFDDVDSDIEERRVDLFD
jgi:hypothetical protein